MSAASVQRRGSSEHITVGSFHQDPPCRAACPAFSVVQHVQQSSVVQHLRQSSIGGQTRGATVATTTPLRGAPGRRPSDFLGRRGKPTFWASTSPEAAPQPGSPRWALVSVWNRHRPARAGPSTSKPAPDSALGSAVGTNYARDLGEPASPRRTNSKGETREHCTSPLWHAPHNTTPHHTRIGRGPPVAGVRRGAPLRCIHRARRVGRGRPHRRSSDDLRGACRALAGPRNPPASAKPRRVPAGAVGYRPPRRDLKWAETGLAGP